MSPQEMIDSFGGAPHMFNETISVHATSYDRVVLVQICWLPSNVWKSFWLPLYWRPTHKITTSLTLRKSGDHVISPEILFCGILKWLFKNVGAAIKMLIEFSCGQIWLDVPVISPHQQQKLLSLELMGARGDTWVIFVQTLTSYYSLQGRTLNKRMTWIFV